ncbi:MAG: chemotaxis protein CheW [Chromatiales bacterium]|nr:chemotaxis protein CheW [Chromatiales bacterium]
MNQDMAVNLELHADSNSQQHLTFVLGDENYGVDILRVQEIKGWSPVTHIPNTPEYMRGVLNLRGTIVPIVDLRMRFNMDTVEYTPLTVVIVLSVKTGDRERTLGIVVDGVSDVLTIKEGELKPTPDFGGAISTEYIKGLVTVDEKMVMLLDIDLLLSIDELKELDTAQ